MGSRHRYECARGSVVKVAATALVLLCAGACCGPKMPDSVDEAGTVRVSISSIGRWSDYREALQPNFPLSEADALAAVIPTTEIREEKRLSATGASAGLSLPTAVTTSTVNTLPNGQPAEDAGSTTVSKKSGEPSVVGPTVAVQGDRTAAGLPGFDAIANATLGRDPMLQYWAATALYQEVKLLDRYVRDAAIGSHRVPYVVRFDIGLMPRRRHLPLDAYINLSFFLNSEDQCGCERKRWTKRAKFKSCERPKAQAQISPTPSVPTPCGPAPCTPAASSSTASTPTPSGPTASTPARSDPCALPTVLPLVATDNIEAALHGRTADQLRSLGLALAGTIQTVGVNAGLEHFNEALQRVLARDLNSVMMVSRLTDNTLRVRLGAVLETETRYAMVPRNQHVTAIVLVPEEVARNADNRELHVWTGMEFVSVKDGHRLDEKSGKKDKQDVAEIADRYDLTPKQVEKAWEKVEDNDWSGFIDQIPAIEGDEAFQMREIWLDIAQFQAGYSFDNVHVELPLYHEPTMVPHQTAFLADDGKESTKVTLVGGSGLDPDTIRAALLFGDGAHPEYVLPPDKTTVSGDGSEVLLTFPSLKAWGLNTYARDKRHLWICRNGEDPAACWRGDALTGGCPLDTAYRIVEPAAPDLGFEVSVLSGVVVESNGKGTFQFTMKQADKDPAASVTVNLAGGDVHGIAIVNRDLKTGSVQELPKQTSVGADFTVTLVKGQATTITLELENLKSGGKVQTTFKNPHGDKTSGKDVPIQEEAKKAG